MLDITDSLLPPLSDREMARTVTEAKQQIKPSRHPQAGLMFAKLAAHHTDCLGTNGEKYYDFGQAMNFKALATCLADYVDPSVTPSNEDPRRPDEEVRRIFALQLMNETNLHQAACMRNGLRRAWYDPEKDYGELRLTKRRRRSALALIDPVAQMDLLRFTMGWAAEEDVESTDAIYFAFASAAEHLKFVRDAHPDSWSAFEVATGVSADMLTNFAGFLYFLDFAAREVGHSLAYTEQKLTTLAAIFKQSFPDSTIDESNVVALVHAFSLTPQDSCRLLLAVPFFRIEGWYLRYVGFDRIMSSGMGLLTILIRMHEKAWNNSVGSTLAYAADVVASTLPSFDRLRVATRRKLKGKGDIDLVLYDTLTRHLLICEVKTVYDKHRTVLHMHRFEEAKVRVDHAVSQLRDAKSAVTSGAVDLSALFGRKLPPPLRVSGALLTWFDPVDLTVGTPDEDIFSLNFATFRHLVRGAAGDIDLLCRGVHDLRNVWCPAELLPIDLQTDFPTFIEVQINAVDAESDLAPLELSPLARSELASMPAVPEDRRASDTQPPLVSYVADSLATLGKIQIRPSSPTCRTGSN